MPPCPQVASCVFPYWSHVLTVCLLCLCVFFGGCRPIWNRCISTSTPCSRSRLCMWWRYTSLRGSYPAPGWPVRSPGFGTSSTGKQQIHTFFIQLFYILPTIGISIFGFFREFIVRNEEMTICTHAPLLYHLYQCSFNHCATLLHREIMSGVPWRMIQFHVIGQKNK